MNVCVYYYQLREEVRRTDEGEEGHRDVEGEVRERDLYRVLRVHCDHHQH